MRIPLLSSPPDVMVSRQTDPEWKKSRIILIDNGSFLLNLPLVNHEHRVLAEKLIAAVGSPGTSFFWKAAPAGRSSTPTKRRPALAIAWRLAIERDPLAIGRLGHHLLLCSLADPRSPQAPAAEVTSDFRKHVDAVGILLRGTRDRGYAQHQIGELAPTAPRAAQRDTRS